MLATYDIIIGFVQRIVTLDYRALYKYSYLLTYLLISVNNISRARQVELGRMLVTHEEVRCVMATLRCQSREGDVRMQRLDGHALVMYGQVGRGHQLHAPAGRLYCARSD